MDYEGRPWIEEVLTSEGLTEMFADGYERIIERMVEETTDGFETTT